MATSLPADATEDRDLMARVQLGDQPALAALMQRWELPVKAVIARLVFNRTEAEELAQATFVRVWQQREKFRTTAEFRPWLFSIAINLARNRLRWWRRRPEVALEEWTEQSDPTADASTALLRQERSAAVRQAIAALPMKLREPLVLFEYEHLSHAEIAAIVGGSAKAVENRVSRAREKLRSALVAWQ